MFQQEGTVAHTWAPVGRGTEVAAEPCRKSAKVFGAVRIDGADPKFHFRFEEDRFNTKTFIVFLKQLVAYYWSRGQKLFMILDNVGYHRAAARWAARRPRRIELHFLPTYSPELNPTEHVWKKTKRAATHNRYFPTGERLRMAVHRRFNRYQGNPAELRGIVQRWL